MAFYKAATTAAVALAVVLALAHSLRAQSKPAGKSQKVDAGTFAIFVNGQRVATETFQIEQGPTVNTVTSEFKMEQGDKAVQKMVLQITSNGDLRRYEWQELSPAKAQISVEPGNDLLLEKINSESQKPTLQSFTLPPSTVVLDDYCFSQREVLAWRYLAVACGNKLDQCRPGKTQFGILVPRQRAALSATLEYVGPEKVTIGGSESELNRIKLRVADDPEWTLYLDGHLKLVKITIPEEKTEVVRQ